MSYAYVVLAGSFMVPPIAFLLLLPFLRRSYARRGEIAGRDLFTRLAFIYYCVIVISLVTFPLPESRSAPCLDPVQPQLHPFHFVADIIDEAAALRSQGVGSFRSVVNGAFMVNAYNVLMLVPLGVFIRGLWRAATPLTVFLAGFCVSLFIELTQLTGIWGLYHCPYRLFEIDDLIMNSAGALIGYFLFPLFKRFFGAKHHHTLAPDISLGRRMIAFVVDLGSTLGVVIGLRALALSGFRLDLDSTVSTAITWIAFAMIFVALPLVFHRTPGQWLTAMRLTSLHPFSIAIIVRNVILFAPAVFSIFIQRLDASIDVSQFIGAWWFILFLTAAFDHNHRAWHDRLSRSFLSSTAKVDRSANSAHGTPE